MKIEFKARSRRIAKAYFIEDFEERNGEEKPFYMVITPLEEEFYYLREDEEGIHITGEGWILYDKSDALEFVRKKREEITDKTKLKFIRIDKEGNCQNYNSYAEKIKIIEVKKIGEDSGNCREYYQNLTTFQGKKFYVRISRGDEKVEWLTTDKNYGEPDCPIKEDIEFRVVEK